MKKAVILFNLGGPDKLENVEPFLFNLFCDPAILNLPIFLRYPLAKIISNRRAPNVHQSTAFPCPFLRRISGARYSGVPHIELAPLLPWMLVFERPKSVIFIYPSLFMITFSGFKLFRILQMKTKIIKLVNYTIKES